VCGVIDNISEFILLLNKMIPCFGSIFIRYRLGISQKVCQPLVRPANGAGIGNKGYGYPPKRLEGLGENKPLPRQNGQLRKHWCPLFSTTRFERLKNVESSRPKLCTHRAYALAEPIAIVAREAPDRAAIKQDEVRQCHVVSTGL
jgi:hypothetical protein